MKTFAIKVIILVGILTIFTVVRAGQEKHLSSALFRMHPVQIDPEPVGELHPKLQWMTKNKVRLAWIG